MRLLPTLATAGVIAAAGLTQAAAADISGAGATFPYPIYAKWADAYKKETGVGLNYQSIGSGGGIKQIQAKTVTFGATDMPLKPAELDKDGLAQFPTVMGGVVPVVNLEGVKAGELSLDGATLAKIFLGQIKTWNDPAIAKLNANVKLPSQPIVVVHRSDGSGTTNTFTTYLNTVSSDWKASGVGAGKEVKWPVGQGAAGNDGVAAGVKNTPGAVGYVELQYAAQARLATAKLKNADGKFVDATTAGVTAAAEGAIDKFPADFRAAPIINGPGADTYPVAAYTYLLVYQDQKDKDKGTDIVSFLAWALNDGQQMESDLGYAPLPAQVKQKALAAVHTITSGGSPIWP
jgi:phosphate transport system substrate-binding protein